MWHTNTAQDRALLSNAENHYINDCNLRLWHIVATQIRRKAAMSKQTDTIKHTMRELLRPAKRRKTQQKGILSRSILCEGVDMTHHRNWTSKPAWPSQPLAEASVTRMHDEDVWP